MNTPAESSSPQPPEPAAIGQAMAEAWVQFAESVKRGRPMSLPNLLRLHQRHAAALGNSANAGDLLARHSAVLEQAYRRHQPFRRGLAPLP